MAWEINEQRAGYTVWAGRDVNGRRVWAVTTNRSGIAVDPTSQGLASKKVALQVYHEDRAQIETIAEKIARTLGNDGQQWETSDGTTFTDLVNMYDGMQADRTNGMHRYVFPDGSALVDSDAGWWDIEGSEPFSAAGAE